MHAQQAPAALLLGAGPVHDLPPARVPGAHARFQAVVTYYDPAENILFVQDATGGVFVNVPKPFPVKAGDLVAVEGSVKYGFRAGVAPDVRMEVVGRGAPVVPQPTTYAALATGKLDCRVVELTGTVLDAVIEQHPESHTETMHMDLALDGGEVEVYVHDYRGLDPMSLLGQRIALTAVAGGAFNAKQQMNGVVLYARDRGDVRALGQTEEPYPALKLATADEIFPTVRFTDHSPRVRLRGTVIAYAPGDSAVLEQGDRSVSVQTRQTSGIAVGDVVEAFGFPDNHSYSPSLRDAVLVNTHVREQIAPKRVSYEQALSGVYADRLITVEGTVLSQLRSAEASSLTLEMNGHTVRGVLQRPAGVPRLPLGSKVRMTGICHIVTGGPWKEPVLFSLNVRSAEDLREIQGPSWWNVRHLAELLGLLLLLSMSVTAWAIVLRRRVARGKARIERSMVVAEKRSSILKQLSLNHPLEEVLASIAAAAETLLPGCRCVLRLGTETESGANRQEQRMVCWPIVKEDSRIGEFSVWAERGKETHVPEDILQMLQELIQLAVSHTSLHEQLLHRSTHDPLTGLANRSLFEERLEGLLAEARSAGTCFSVVYIDVDQFKSVNDRFGHRVGDLYLQSIGKRLSAKLRDDCTVARVGGDEFVILVPHCDACRIEGLCERLGECFVAPFALGSFSLQGSASFGAASFPAHGSTREELEHYADVCMYAQKARGSQSELVSC